MKPVLSFLPSLFFCLCISGQPAPLNIGPDPLNIDVSKKLPYKNTIIQMEPVKGKVKTIDLEYYGVFEIAKKDSLIKVPGNGKKFSFDEGGRLLEELNYFEDKVFARTKYIYDTENNLTGVDFDNLSGGERTYTSYEYDKQFGLVRKEQCNGTLVIYNYDNQGRLSEKKYRSDNRKWLDNIAYEYYPNTVLPKKELHYTIGEDALYTFYYDADENLTSQVQIRKINRFTDSTIYRYDLHKNIIKTESYGNYPGSETFVYEYDEFSNWVKKIHFSNGQKSWVIIRRIEYYN